MDSLLRNWSVRTWLAILNVVVASALVGCGKGGPEVVPASGQVFIDGQPLAAGVEGFVQVLPAEGRAATGSIDPQTGKFTLTTLEKDDGCPVGTHKVAVILRTMVGNNSVSLIDEKYSEPETSGLTVTVEEATDSLKIDLAGPLQKPAGQPAPISDDPNKF